MREQYPSDFDGWQPDDAFEDGYWKGLADGERSAILRVQMEVTRLSECGDDGDVVLDVTALESVLQTMLEGTE